MKFLIILVIFIVTACSSTGVVQMRSYLKHHASGRQSRKSGHRVSNVNNNIPKDPSKYTGAADRRPRLIEQAAGGTLFSRRSGRHECSLAD